MPALLIADIEVTDAAGYEEYQRRVPDYVAAPLSHRLATP